MKKDAEDREKKNGDPSSNSQYDRSTGQGCFLSKVKICDAINLRKSLKCEKMRRKNMRNS